MYEVSEEIFSFITREEFIDMVVSAACSDAEDELTVCDVFADL